MKKTILMAIAAAALLAGCTGQKQDSQPSTQQTAAVTAQSISDTQKQIQAIQSNPGIPDATKQTLVAHLQSNIDRTKATGAAAPK